MGFCQYNCNDRGMVFNPALKIFQPCPNCRNIDTMLVKEDSQKKSIMDKLFIPLEYRDIGEVGSELLVEVNGFSKESANVVASELHEIKERVYRGTLIPKSVYFFIPTQIDIKKYIYSAQKLALEKGMGVTPYISLNSLYSLIKLIDHFDYLDTTNGVVNSENKTVNLALAQEGYNLYKSSGMTYYDFTKADICFLEATAMTAEKSWIALADLLAERSRLGLPTYVFGYWQSTGNSGLKYLVSEEKSVRKMEFVGYKQKKSAGEVLSRYVPKDLGVVPAYGQGGVNIAEEIQKSKGSIR